jgi:hypothetical protein
MGMSRNQYSRDGQDFLRCLLSNDELIEVLHELMEALIDVY